MALHITINVFRRCIRTSVLAGRLISRWAFDQQEESFSNKEKKTYSFMFYMIVFATVT